MVIKKQHDSYYFVDNWNGDKTSSILLCLRIDGYAAITEKRIDNYLNLLGFSIIEAFFKTKTRNAKTKQHKSMFNTWKIDFVAMKAEKVHSLIQPQNCKLYTYPSNLKKVMEVSKIVIRNINFNI